MITEDQFADCYTKNYERVAKLLRTKYYYQFSEEELIDYAQDAWVRAWEKREQWQGRNTFLSWVTTIAINLVRTELRHRQYVMVAVPFTPKMKTIPDVEDKILAEQLLSSVANRQVRAAMRLYYWGGLDFKAIAKPLGIPYTRYKLRVFRQNLELRNRFA